MRHCTGNSFSDGLVDGRSGPRVLSPGIRCVVMIGGIVIVLVASVWTHLKRGHRLLSSSPSLRGDERKRIHSTKLHSLSSNPAAKPHQLHTSEQAPRAVHIPLIMKPSVPAFDSPPSLQSLQQAAHVVAYQQQQADELFRDVLPGIPFGLSRSSPPMTDADRRRLLIRVLDAALEVTMDLGDIVRREMEDVDRGDVPAGAGGEQQGDAAGQQPKNRGDGPSSKDANDSHNGGAGSVRQ